MEDLWRREQSRGTLISYNPKNHYPHQGGKLFKLGDVKLDLHSHKRNIGAFKGTGEYMMRCASVEEPIQACYSAETPDYLTLETTEQPKLEIAAGARIRQQVHKDPHPLDYWNEAPTSILYVNYATETLAKTIRSKGQIGSTTEGGLCGLKVGN